MDDLIERLQKTGPDREIDIAIAYACLPLHHNGRWGVVSAPLFTSSIDAALPGEDIIGTAKQKPVKEGDPTAWVAIHAPPGGKGAPVAGRGRTEAIARRVAALKARHVLNSQ